MNAPEPERRRTELRRAAEHRLRAVGTEVAEPGLEQAQLIHELQVHHVELEMQNEELLSAHAEVACSAIRYQRLYELAPVGCVTLDRSGRVQESNLRAAILLGVAHSELEGRPLQKFMPQLAADILHRHLRNVFETRNRQTCKIVLERNGTKPGPLPVRIESIAIPDDTAKRMLCQSVLINLSELREAKDDPQTSEAGTKPAATAPAADPIASIPPTGNIDPLHQATRRLDSVRDEHDFAERLLATAPVLVLVLDLDGRIVRFNHCFEDVTGYRLDDVRGTDWFTTFLPKEDHEQTRSAFMRSLWGETTSGMVNPIRTKAGSLVQIEWHNALLRDTGGNVSGALSIGLDRTQRQQPG